MKMYVENPFKSIEFCTKKDNRVGGPWEKGTRPSFNVKGEKSRLINKMLLEKDSIDDSNSEKKIKIKAKFHRIQFSEIMNQKKRNAIKNLNGSSEIEEEKKCIFNENPRELSNIYEKENKNISKGEK